MTILSIAAFALFDGVVMDADLIRLAEARAIENARDEAALVAAESWVADNAAWFIATCRRSPGLSVSAPDGRSTIRCLDAFGAHTALLTSQPNDSADAWLRQTTVLIAEGRPGIERTSWRAR